MNKPINPIKVHANSEIKFGQAQIDLNKCKHIEV